MTKAIIRNLIFIGWLLWEAFTYNVLEFFWNQKFFAAQLCAFVNLPQNYFHLIKDGQEAEVTIPQLPKKIFIGRVDRNSGALDPVSRTLLTQVNIDNPNGELLPGLYAEVKFKFKPEEQTFIVPIQAVIIRKGKKQLN